MAKISIFSKWAQGPRSAHGINANATLHALFYVRHALGLG